MKNGALGLFRWIHFTSHATMHIRQFDIEMQLILQTISCIAVKNSKFSSRFQYIKKIKNELAGKIDPKKKSRLQKKLL